MAVLDQLEPKGVFAFFEQLCSIPHGSGNTKAVSDWLVSFAAERGLERYQDGAGNVIIIREAAPGYENAAPVILQGHMDMVCEKTADCPLDMERDGLDLVLEGDRVFARGTTLGGDDGIAVAMMLAILDDGSLPRPRVECVFTVDEEIGLLGAAALDTSPLRGRTMINLDSEAEGIFTASCAGGRGVNCVLPIRRAPFSGAALTVEITGLTGGHSGTEINRGRANADMLLGRLLWALCNATPTRLTEARGGTKDNAIPARAMAAVVVEDAAAAAQVCRNCEDIFRREYDGADPDIRVTLEPGETGTPLDGDSTARAICLLRCAPCGVQAMSRDVEGLVETSLNLGILKTGQKTLEAMFSVRSSVESRKEWLTGTLQCLAERLGGYVELSGDYPGWEFRRVSPLRETMAAVFREQYGKEPVVDAIHAGLECGLFAGKLPGLDCVSIGPDLLEIHTPRETMSVSSVQRTWALVLETLKRLK